jgi:hypothetical protein
MMWIIDDQSEMCEEDLIASYYAILKDYPSAQYTPLMDYTGEEDKTSENSISINSEEFDPEADLDIFDADGNCFLELDGQRLLLSTNFGKNIIDDEDPKWKDIPERTIPEPKTTLATAIVTTTTQQTDLPNTKGKENLILLEKNLQVTDLANESQKNPEHHQRS